MTLAFKEAGTRSDVAHSEPFVLPVLGTSRGRRQRARRERPGAIVPGLLEAVKESSRSARLARRRSRAFERARSRVPPGRR